MTLEAKNVPTVVGEECCDHTLEKGAEPELDEEQGDGIPDIAKTLIYYGLGADKKSDPSKILYYERPDGSCIDVSSGAIGSRPSVLDHLPSRPITMEERDVVSAMAHGAMSDNDYDALDGAGLIGDTAKALWAKLQMLRSQMAKSELAKSDDGEGAEEPKEEQEPKEKAEEEPSEQADEKTEPSSEGESDQLKEVREDVGEDVFQEIMDLAMAKALNAVTNDMGLESKIREIIKHVLEEGKAEEATEEDVVAELESDAMGEPQEVTADGK